MIFRVPCHTFLQSTCSSSSSKLALFIARYWRFLISLQGSFGSLILIYHRKDVESKAILPPHQGFLPASSGVLIMHGWIVLLLNSFVITTLVWNSLALIRDMYFLYHTVNFGKNKDAVSARGIYNTGFSIYDRRPICWGARLRQDGYLYSVVLVASGTSRVRGQTITGGEAGRVGAFRRLHFSQVAVVEGRRRAEPQAFSWWYEASGFVSLNRN